MGPWEMLECGCTGVWSTCGCGGYVSVCEERSVSQVHGGVYGKAGSSWRMCSVIPLLPLLLFEFVTITCWLDGLMTKSLVLTSVCPFLSGC